MGWPYQQKPPMGWPLDYDSGLVPNAGFWPMPEGSGNKVFDLSGNGNTGTYMGTPDWGAGFYGSQVRCDDDQYITFANKATDYFTDQFTVVWIGTPARLISSVRYFFVGQYEFDGIDYDWGLYLNADGTVHFFVRNAATDAVFSTSTSSVVVGTKVCIVGRYDGVNLSNWFNGVKEDEDAQTGNVQGSFDFKLGHTYGTTAYADVKTDVLAIYNRALSDFEIPLLCREPFCMFKDPAEVALLGSYQAVVGAAGIMTTNPGIWGPTF